MNKAPHPRMFFVLELYARACEDHAESLLPAVTHYDSDAEAKAKREAIAKARDDAADAAFDRWLYWIECAQERFDRGVGPSWT